MFGDKEITSHQSIIQRMLDDSDTKFEKMAIYDKMYTFLKESFFLKKSEQEQEAKEIKERADKEKAQSLLDNQKRQYSLSYDIEKDVATIREN